MQFYWNGATPGVWVGSDSTAAIAAVHALLVGCANAFSTTVAMQVQPAVEVVEATTGALIGIVPGTPVANVAGTSAGNVLTAEGPLLQWFTSTVVGRRILRGRTFLTPSSSGALDTNGTVLAAVTGPLIAAANTYIAHSPEQPVIWHRPVPFGTGANGVAAVIVATGSPSKVAVLRSRRD
jgi:hypothetical protein